MRKKWIILCFILEASILMAVEITQEFNASILKPIDCSIQVPKDWYIIGKSNQTSSSWIITPDDLTIADYQTGVKIDSLSQVKDKTGVIASKWVADRIHDKSTSLKILKSEVGSTNDYFKVKRLSTREVYSSGKTHYATYHIIYSWFWNDDHDIVICMEARTPEKSWVSASTFLEKIGKLEFNVSEWKKKLTKTEEQKR
ncbi:MAG: hypothetical protein PF692_14420 [Kiritimatiellae bacterium]|jgi:hypothetical protein|nr:hypothetical protein [Kiritimatiellia bacterium]